MSELAAQPVQAGKKNWDITEILKEAVALNASDLHLVAGAPPTVRVAKELSPMGKDPLDYRSIEAMMLPHMQQHQKERFIAESRVNFVLSVPFLGRFRVCYYRSKGEVGAVCRILALPIKPLHELGLPPQLPTLFQRTSGLLLVTGSTGSGKSTTLASIVDFINRGPSPKKVITIEDPIEYEHGAANGIVVQREVGTDTPTFHAALVDSLRQDPNIIVIGELREPESIITALTAAETGHLVMATLHTPDAPSAVSRMISAVPGPQQDLVRGLMGSTLVGVVMQELLPRADKKGLVMAAELMIATEAVRRVIRENKSEQLYDMIQTGSNVGMVSRDQSLASLVKKGLITREMALPRMRIPSLLGV